MNDGFENFFLKEEVIEEEIFSIVLKWIGILVIKLVEGEREKLFKLEDEFYKRVIG